MSNEQEEGSRRSRPGDQAKDRPEFTAEEKIRIVLEGLRGEDTIAALCRREGISPNLYYNWSKEFLEAGQQRLLENTKRQSDSTDMTFAGQASPMPHCPPS